MKKAVATYLRTGGRIMTVKISSSSSFADIFLSSGSTRPRKADLSFYSASSSFSIISLLAKLPN